MRFRCVRTVLRLLLGSYLATKPHCVCLTYGAQGKPAMDGLRFNISHSGDLAVFAFTLLPAVGIDVEELREVSSAFQIAEYYFSRAERDALASLTEDQSESFLRCWTRKEAVVKALGGGLAIDLASFDVSLDREPRLCDLRDAPSSATDWRLYNLALPAGFVGALALHRPSDSHRIRHMSFAP